MKYGIGASICGESVEKGLFDDGDLDMLLVFLISAFLSFEKQHKKLDNKEIGRNTN